MEFLLRKGICVMDLLWMPQIDAMKCTGCGDCITACPTDALGRRNEKATLVKPEACTYCAICEELCPVDAIVLPYLIVTELQTKDMQNAK